MADYTHQPFDGLFYVREDCPRWCGGHVDADSMEHTSSTDRFGPLSPVVLTQKPDRAPTVGLVLSDLRAPEHAMTIEAAELLAFQLTQAAAVLRRYEPDRAEALALRPKV